MRKLLASLLALGFLPSCVTLGPKVESRTVFVHTANEKGEVLEVGKVAKNVKVPVLVKDNEGKEIISEQDIGGWGVVHPNAMQRKP